MPVKLSPPPRQQYMDANGDPAVGCKLFAYAAGSSTKQSTFTDNTGLTANTNPIILDASGRTPFGLWLETGLAYKFVLAPATDTDPPTSPIFTEDLVMGINDITTPAALSASSQWVASGVTPTYVNATQFTLVGDQRAAFHVGRRLRLTVTAGTIYGEISVSAFTTLTTVTVVLDSGALDAGLSAVDVGILTVTNSSIPKAETLGAQPLDTLLTNLAALDASLGLVEQTGVDTFTKRAIGGGASEIPTNSLIASVPVGTIIDFAGTTPPAGFLSCPTSAANISRATYAALFTAIGETWGAGDGTTTFGMPWFPADYASVQANANVGTATVGAVIAHTHTETSAGVAGVSTVGGANLQGGASVTGSTGGAANLAAGHRVLKCVKY